MTLANQDAPSPARAALGFLGAGTVAASLLVEARDRGTYAIAAAALAAALATRGGPLLTQISARAFFALLTVVGCTAIAVEPGATSIAVTGGSLLALLAPGMAPLESDRALQAFHPVAERTAFLVAATAAMAAAGPLLLCGVEMLASWGSFHLLGGFSVALSLLATVGVAALLRMRAIGIVAIATAGATAAIIALTLATTWGRTRLGLWTDGYLFVPYALAGASFSSIWVALLAARWRAARRVRVATSGSSVAALTEAHEFETEEQEARAKTYAM